MSKTEEEKFTISLTKNKAFYAYARFCSEISEIPKRDLVEIINICEDANTLKKFETMFDQKLEEWRHLKESEKNKE